MSDVSADTEELRVLITKLQERVDAQEASSVSWTSLTSGMKLLWGLLGCVFVAGGAFAVFSDSIVRREEFDPVRVAVTDLSAVPKQLASIEKVLVQQRTCSIHEATYIRDLADYAAKVRRKPPVLSPAYRDCLTKLSSVER